VKYSEEFPSQRGSTLLQVGFMWIFHDFPLPSWITTGYGTSFNGSIERKNSKAAQWLINRVSSESLVDRVNNA